MHEELKKLFRALRGFASLALLLAASAQVHAAGPVPGPGPWVPIFKGVDRAIGTNNPSLPGSFSTLQVANCVRVDLTDPDIRFFTTPKASSYVAESRETLSLTVSNFLKNYKLQVACDANYYNANPGGSDPTSQNVPCEVFGLQVCTGAVVSPCNNYEADPRYASILFTTNNQPRFAFNNRAPGTNLTGIANAVTGYYPILSNGVNIGAASITAYPDSWIHQLQPRTVFGVSQDNHYLYLMTIDGRQSGYSDGAYDSDSATWILQFGAWNAINMDGGGSTTLDMSDSAGNPVPINRTSYVFASSPPRERYIGSHFGVYAQPVPGFFTNVMALPDDTAATITWGTIDPATTQLKYGLDTNVTSATVRVTNLVANHAVLLTNLTPNTTYYFQAISSIGASQWNSSVFAFATTNYVITNQFCDFTSTWKYTTANLDGSNWTASGYDDSAWEGSGPGLLWCDTYCPACPNPNIPEPMSTQIPLDAGFGVPFSTYYFRTHFTATNAPGNLPLVLEDYVADGAVVYLNGTELYRVRMPTGPTFNALSATGHPCSGDATCPDDMVITGLLATNLLLGDNVLAVEVHTDTIDGAHAATFGLSLVTTNPFTLDPALNYASSNANLTLTWDRGGFTLQQAASPKGPWTNTPGPVVSSPFTTPVSGAARFYRLKK